MSKISLVCAGFLLGTVLGGQAVAQQPAQELQYFLQGGSYLGIGVREVDNSRVEALKLKEERGAEVTSVEPGSPAEQAGVKVGDVVIEFAGERVQGIDQFMRLVREMPGGRKVKMAVWRNGATTNLTITVGTRKSITQRLPKIELPAVPAVPGVPDIPHPTTTWRTSSLGVEAEAIEGQLAQYFGVSNGVLIRAVLEGSAAEKAGLKAGDVITKIGSNEVATPRDVSRQLRDFEGRTAQVTVMRDRKETTVPVNISSEAGRNGARSRGRLEIVAE